MRLRPTHLIAAAAVIAAVGLTLPAPTIGPADADLARDADPDADLARDADPDADLARGADPDADPGAARLPELATPGPEAPAVATLAIADFAFGAVTVAPGTTVAVSNTDSAPHTVTGAGFDVAVDADGTASFVAPSTPGEHPFQCRIHPAMQGVLVVR